MNTRHTWARAVIYKVRVLLRVFEDGLCRSQARIACASKGAVNSEQRTVHSFPATSLQRLSHPSTTTLFSGRAARACVCNFRI